MEENLSPSTKLIIYLWLMRLLKNISYDVKYSNPQKYCNNKNIKFHIFPYVWCANKYTVAVLCKTRIQCNIEFLLLKSADISLKIFQIKILEFDKYTERALNNMTLLCYITKFVYSSKRYLKKYIQKNCIQVNKNLNE